MTVSCFDGPRWGLLGQKGTTFPSFSPFRTVALKELGPSTRKVQLRAPSPHCHRAIRLHEPTSGADKRTVFTAIQRVCHHPRHSPATLHLPFHQLARASLVTSIPELDTRCHARPSCRCHFAWRASRPAHDRRCQLARLHGIRGSSKPQAARSR